MRLLLLKVAVEILVLLEDFLLAVEILLLLSEEAVRLVQRFSLLEASVCVSSKGANKHIHKVKVQARQCLF